LIWDMRYPGFKSFDGMILYSSPNVGPKAVPGTYKVRLTYNNEVMLQDFEILKDPRLSNTQNDYLEQFNFLISVRDQVSISNQTIIDIRKIKKDLQYIIDKSSDKKQLLLLINEFSNKLSVIENKIHMTKNQSRQDPLNYGIRINNRLAFLMADSQRGDFPPTDQSIEFFNVIKEELNYELASFNKVLNTYVSQINNMIEDNNIKFISF